jgi:hypothetical protein
MRIMVKVSGLTIDERSEATNERAKEQTKEQTKEHTKEHAKERSTAYGVPGRWNGLWW